jgi:predicted dehydrogenase
MSQREPVRLGVAGLGGYGRAVREAIARYGEAAREHGEPPATLAAACDIRPDAFPELVDELKSNGVAVFDDYQRMLAEPLDAVWLPLPIDLHQPFTEGALAAGKAVICEKPAAGTVDEVEAMIAARDETGLPVQIAFQHMFDSNTPRIVRRLREGAIGRIRRASLVCCWPRPESYYQRNDWAGAIQRNGRWVLDSPAQNAMAHFLQLMLHFIGGEPRAIEAELYRARPIENFDTGALRIAMPGDVTATALLTHACGETRHPEIIIEGDAGRMEWRFGGAVFKNAAGEETDCDQADDQVRVNIVRRIVAEMRGGCGPESPGCSLESARPHTVAVNAAAEAARVHPIPDAHYEVHDNGLRAIEGIETAFERCAASGQLLHESGVLPWTAPPGRIDIDGYTHFSGPRPE